MVLRSALLPLKAPAHQRLVVVGLYAQAAAGPEGGGGDGAQQGTQAGFAHDF